MTLVLSIRFTLFQPRSLLRERFAADSWVKRTWLQRKDWLALRRVAAHENSMLSSQLVLFNEVKPNLTCNTTTTQSCSACRTLLVLCGVLEGRGKDPCVQRTMRPCSSGQNGRRGGSSGVCTSARRSLPAPLQFSGALRRIEKWRAKINVLHPLTSASFGISTFLGRSILV